MSIYDSLVSSSEEGFIRFEKATVQSQIYSLLMMVRCTEAPHLNPWVCDVYKSFTDKRKKIHRIVTEGMFYAIQINKKFENFPQYLNYMKDSDPLCIRNRMLFVYAGMPTHEQVSLYRVKVNQDTTDLSPMLIDKKSYLKYLYDRFEPHKINEDIESIVFEYLQKPEEMKELIIEHLSFFWENHLSKEWQIYKNDINNTLEWASGLKNDFKSRIDAIYQITGQKVYGPKWIIPLEKVEKFIIAPSPHMGPHLGRLWLGDHFYLFVDCFRYKEIKSKINKQKLLNKLALFKALADENRLEIIELLHNKGELSSNDIRSLTGMTQSTASRHLTQLDEGGILLQRREKTAKYFSLNYIELNSSFIELSDYFKK